MTPAGSSRPAQTGEGRPTGAPPAGSRRSAWPASRRAAAPHAAGGWALAGLLTTCLAIFLPALLPAAAWATDASPSGSASSSPGPGADLQVHLLEPRAPTADSTLLVAGTVANGWDRPMLDVRVRLRMSSERVVARSRAGDILDAQNLVGSSVTGSEVRVAATLGGGARATYRLSVPLSEALPDLPASAVLPIAVEVRARGGDSSSLRSVGHRTTLLPVVQNPADFLPSRLAWLWPLAAPPDRSADGSFPNDMLETALAPQGRLWSLLSQALATAPRPARPAGVPAVTPQRPVPVVVCLDPALLDDAAALAGDGSGGGSASPAGPGAPAGSQVPGESSANPTATPGPAGFLPALRDLASRSSVVSVPYANPDAVALVRASMQSDLVRADTDGRSVVRSVLGVEPAPGVARPPGGYVDQATLDVLSQAGKATVVLSGAAAPQQESSTAAPSAVASLPVSQPPGAVRALFTDPRIDATLAAGGTQEEGPRLAEQAFLADTLLLTLERPSTQRLFLAAPPLVWNPNPSFSGAVLQDTGRVPWLTPATLADLLTAPPPEVGEVREGLRYPSSARSAELPQSYLADEVSPAKATAATLIGALVRSTGLASQLRHSGYGTESASWRANLVRGRSLVAGLRNTANSLIGDIRVASGGTITLTSRTGDVPLTIANGLPEPVRVRLTLDGSGVRLEAAESGAMLIAGGHQVQVDVEVTAATSGTFPVQAQLETPAGRPLGPPTPLVLKSSQYGTLAIAITVGALTVLLVTVAVRLTRRVLRARRQAAP